MSVSFMRFDIEGNSGKDFKFRKRLSSRGDGAGIEHVFEVKIQVFTEMTSGVKSHARKRVENGELVHNPGRPDLDHSIWAILNTLTKKVWCNDSRVVKISADKYYSDRDYILVEIKSIKRKRTK